MSGPRDLALVQPDFQTALAAAVTQTVDLVATAITTAVSDITMSRLQNL